ncbi:MAG: DUF192 domain-containing protein [Thiobacillus sp.]
MHCSAGIQRFLWQAPSGRVSKLALAALLSTACATASEAHHTLTVGGHLFKVEIAATPNARERGLMERARLPADGGMLFVFEHAARHCFWMHNTPLPLSIAFVDEQGRIAHLADMQPHSPALHCPPADVRYALEVPQGSFRQRGIAIGTRVDGLPR